MLRKMFYVMVAGFSAALIGCDGTVPTAPTVPTAVATPRAPAFMTIGLPPPPPPPAPELPGSVAADIGPNGGTLSFGGNSLVVPAGSLAQIVHIVMVPACTASSTPGGGDNQGDNNGRGNAGKGHGNKGDDHGNNDRGTTVVAAVQFFPEGLVFAAPAPPTLTVNTNCVGNPDKASIVYTDDAGNVLERFKTKTTTDSSISAVIHHFSRYAIAW